MCWSLNDSDKTISNEIRDFLPVKIFDAHAHLYRKEDLSPTLPDVIKNGPEEAGIDEWRKSIERQTGKSPAGGLFMGMPTAGCDIERLNTFVTSQLSASPESRGVLLISPETDFSSLEISPRIAGFKPYHIFIAKKPTFEAAIGDYLPEAAWKTADEKGLVIVLHLVKNAALSDPGNQSYIREKCLKYPTARLILAHCARGFHAPNTVNGIQSLRGIENVWFDTSGICEAAAIKAIISEFGHSRLLWGTDFPVSEMRGRCVTVGDAFSWIAPEHVDVNPDSPVCHPTLVGLESLRALREAAENTFLNEDDLEDIFFNNAVRFLGIEPKSSNVTQKLYEHAKRRIPGGTQLLSKRPEMLAPGKWPAYYSRARGCETWDLEGRRYIDMSTNGIGSCLLGFADPDVTRAVQRAVGRGSMSTLNPPEEVELSDLLCKIHPWADQVRLTRAGGEAMAAAVRIARATTDRSVVAVCGYHGWHDWYLAANLGEDDSLRGHLLPGLEPLGVPTELRGTTATFRYNSRDEFQSVMEKFGDRLAAVVMEPCRFNDPEPGFLEFVRDGAHSCGALLVFDEITIGWRLHFGGAHLKLGVSPDIAVFAKALGNGHPIGAVIGTSKAMEGAHSSFISSTYWTESVGPAAALATIKKMQKTDVPAHVAHIGNLVAKSWINNANKHGLPAVAGEGHSCLAHFRFDHELATEMRTLYTRLMLDRGFLAGTAIYPTLAHTEETAALYGNAIDEVFGEIATALKAGRVAEMIEGKPAHTGFSRLL